MKSIIFLLLFSVAFAQPITLTPDEEKIIKIHTLKCISTGLWAPFNLIEDEKLAGIGLDYWDLICDRLNIKNNCRIADTWSQVLDEIKNKKSDMTIATQSTKKRLKFASFSKSYVSYPIVIATRNDVGFIHDIGQLTDKTFAIGKDYTVASILKEHYPSLKIKYVDSIDVALDLVDKGKAFATLEALPVLAYKLNKNKFYDLKISGDIPYSFAVGIMVRKEKSAIIPLINKAIDSITKKEKNKINKRWVTIHHERKISSRYFYMLLFGALFILLLLGVWLLLLKKEIFRNEKIKKDLRMLVGKDGLTSVYNRYLLDLTLDKEIAFAKRHNRPLSIIFLDIDGFKNINDWYGHEIGDSVLKDLSSLIVSSIRESDIFGRWGGDEFLLILPGTREVDSMQIKKHLCDVIKNHDFEKHIPISCSFGVTSYREGDSLGSMLARVDKIFYKSKKIKSRNNKK